MPVARPPITGDGSPAPRTRSDRFPRGRLPAARARMDTYRGTDLPTLAGALVRGGDYDLAAFVDAPGPGGSTGHPPSRQTNRNRMAAHAGPCGRPPRRLPEDAKHGLHPPRPSGADCHLPLVDPRL